MVEECMFGSGVELRDYQRIFIIIDPIISATYWTNFSKKKWSTDEIVACK